MDLCKQCGKELWENADFCTFCGAPAGQDGKAEVPVEFAAAQFAADPASAPFPATPPAYNVPPPVYGAPPIYNAPTPAYGAPAAYGIPPAYGLPHAGPGRNTFVGSFLSVVLLGALLIAALLTGVITQPRFFDPRNLNNIFVNFCLLGAVAFAATVSTRAKGPDLSTGALMTLTAVIIVMGRTMFDSPAVAILASVGICAGIGLINGVLITCLCIPAVIVTLLTGIISQYVAVLLTDGIVMQAEEAVLIARGPLGAIALLLITLVIAFFTIFPSKLGKPIYKRDKKGAFSYVLAYASSAVIASLAGVFLLSQRGAAMPTAGTGYEPFILFVFACAISSRVMDNRIAPALYAAAPALLFAVLNNVLTINAVTTFVHVIVNGGIVLIFIIVAFAVKPKPQPQDVR